MKTPLIEGSLYKVNNLIKEPRVLHTYRYGKYKLSVGTAYLPGSSNSCSSHWTSKASSAIHRTQKMQMHFQGVLYFPPLINASRIHNVIKSSGRI
ncbi:apolipoprotein B-100 [Oceanobacillus picturae]|uniref:Apolipoprotein B-100, partial n=1 Tax=Oceanobacillus picturae TaxID=171693 RepID=A0A0U9H799_9BACI|nr:apolipoprotein B-100 [Oceanobacillus picturae]